jgi:hypothetical protein
MNVIMLPARPMAVNGSITWIANKGAVVVIEDRLSSRSDQWIHTKMRANAIRWEAKVGYGLGEATAIIKTHDVLDWRRCRELIGREKKKAANCVRTGKMQINPYARFPAYMLRPGIPHQNNPPTRAQHPILESSDDQPPASAESQQKATQRSVKGVPMSRSYSFGVAR